MGLVKEELSTSADYTEIESLLKTPIRDYWDWARFALCRDKPAYFSSGQKSSKLAKFICSMCPVAPDCLIWSLVYNEEGVWGGLTELERSRKYTKRIRTELTLRVKDSGNYYSRGPLATYLEEFRTLQGGQS